MRERMEALADEYDQRAEKAARRSLSDPNAYLRMTVWEAAARGIRQALAGTA
jgi:hypothetical protein